MHIGYKNFRELREMQYINTLEHMNKNECKSADLTGRKEKGRYVLITLFLLSVGILKLTFQPSIKHSVHLFQTFWKPHVSIL